MAGIKTSADRVGAVRRVGEAVLLAPVGHFMVGLVCRSGYTHLASHHQWPLASFRVEISDHDCSGVVSRWEICSAADNTDVCTVSERLLRPTAKSLCTIFTFSPRVGTTPSPLEYTA